VLNRIPEGFDRLTGQVAPAAIDDRDRDEEWDLRRHFLDGCDRSLAVQGVEDRFDQEDVDAAFLQRERGLGVTLTELVESDLAVRRVFDPRRERERHVCRTQRAGDEPVFELVRGLACESRAFEVHLVDVLLEAVVRL
jgi:hypothetical protein